MSLIVKNKPSKSLARNKTPTTREGRLHLSHCKYSAYSSIFPDIVILGSYLADSTCSIS